MTKNKFFLREDEKNDITEYLLFLKNRKNDQKFKDIPLNEARIIGILLKKAGITTTSSISLYLRWLQNEATTFLNIAKIKCRKSPNVIDYTKCIIQKETESLDKQIAGVRKASGKCINEADPTKCEQIIHEIIKELEKKKEQLNVK